MATKITYKNVELAEVKNNTKTLKTAGKYMEADVVLTDITSSGGSSALLFIDVDGEILQSYDKASALLLNDLPSLPTRPRLTCQGWNWTLAQIQAQLTADPDQQIVVGPLYTPTSGKTEIDIAVPENNWTTLLGLGVIGTIEIDWGDGTTSSLSGNSYGNAVEQSHTYATAGDYIVTLTVTTGDGFAFRGTSGLTNLFRDPNYGSYTATYWRMYSSAHLGMVKAIRFGPGANIQNDAFYYLQNLQWVSMPNTLRSIANNAFSFCSSLQALVLPPSDSTGQSLCSSCGRLQSVSLPPTLLTIGTGSFMNCYALENIGIPNSVINVDNSAFYRCSALKKIKVISDVNTQTFYYAYALKDLKFKDSITKIDSYALAECYALEGVILPDDLTTLGNYALQKTNIKELSVPTGVTSIPQYLCSDCIALEDVELLGAVTSLGRNAFGGCFMLQKINLPNALTSIGQQTFYRCYSLTNITIPAACTSIAASAFYECFNLREVHMLGSTPPSLANINAFQSTNSALKIYVPQGSLSAYQAATNWSNFASQMVEE